MDKKAYEFMIWQQENLIYYNDFTNTAYDYEELRNTHRIQNCQGLSISLSALIKQIHPDRKTQFKNFRTREYQFNLLDTLNGLKFILITSVRPEEDNLDIVMKKIYEGYV